MRLPHGSLVSDNNGICQSWVDYYSSLFSAGTTDPETQESLLVDLYCKLIDDARMSSEGLLSIQEVHAALVGLSWGSLQVWIASQSNFTLPSGTLLFPP